MEVPYEVGGGADGQEASDLGGVASSGDTKFDASQYSFFGNKVMEEFELGGLEGDDDEGQADFVGPVDDKYPPSCGGDILEEEGIDSRTYVDYLAGTFSKEKSIGSRPDVDGLAGTFSKMTRIAHVPEHHGVVGHGGSVSRQTDWAQAPEYSLFPEQPIFTERRLDNQKWSSQSSHVAHFADPILHRTSLSLQQDARYNLVEPNLGSRPFSLHRMSSYPQQEAQYNCTEPIPEPNSSFISYPSSASVSHSSRGEPHHRNMPHPLPTFHMPVSAQNELPRGALSGRNIDLMGSLGLSTNNMQQNHVRNRGPIRGNGDSFRATSIQHPVGLIPPHMLPLRQHHGMLPTQHSSPQFSPLQAQMLGPMHCRPQNLDMFSPQHPPSQDESMLVAARTTVDDGLVLLRQVDGVDRLLHLYNKKDRGWQLRNREQILGLRSRRRALLEQLAASLQLVDPLTTSQGTVLPNDDLVFLHIISLAKGRELLSRYLKLVPPSSEFGMTACMAVFRHLGFIFGNQPSDNGAAIATIELASSVSCYVLRMNLSGLTFCLAAMLLSSSQPPLRPLEHAEGFRASVIIKYILERAADLHSGQHAVSTCHMQDVSLWQTFFDAFFGLLIEYCTRIYDTAQMQPAAAAVIQRELPVELLRASFPHINEHQRNQLLDLSQRPVPGNGQLS